MNWNLDLTTSLRIWLKKREFISKKLKQFLEWLLRSKSKLLSSKIVNFQDFNFTKHKFCLSRYSNSKKGDRLKELQEKKSLLESQLQSCETRMQEIIDELDKRKDLLRNTDLLRRKIEDNLNYRKTKAEVDELEREIEILEENMLKIGVSDTIQTEHQKLSQDRQRLLSEVFSYVRHVSSHLQLLFSIYFSF